MSLLWLINLPADDPAFEPLRRAQGMDPEDSIPLARAHRQAINDAAWGRDVDYTASLLREQTRHRDESRDAREAEALRAAELEALGYALGATAVHVAIRERAEKLGAVA